MMGRHGRPITTHNNSSTPTGDNYVLYTQGGRSRRAARGRAVRRAPAWAWPDHPTALVVGFAPGRGTALTARPLAALLEKAPRTPIVVQN